MTRSLGPPDYPDPSYPVPWVVDRRDRTHPVIANRGGANSFVRAFARTTLDPGRTMLWGHVRPGDQLEVCLCGTDLEDVVVTIAWFRPEDGLEYVWRFVV